MQQILPTESVFWPCYFKHIKKDHGAKCKRKPQRQPAPMRKIGFKTNVPAQHPNQLQNDAAQCQAKKAVCRPVDALGESQLQSKRQPDKYHSQESQVIQGDMEDICIQVFLYLNPRSKQLAY